MTEGVDINTAECLSYLRRRVGPVGFSESEAGEKFLPVCCEVKEYLSIFRKSGEYRQMVDSRFKSTQKKYKEISNFGHYSDTPPTREEVVKAFEEGEPFKQLFWNFNERVLHLAYDPGKHSDKFNRLFDGYRVDAAASIAAVQKGDRDEIIEKDRIRSESHNEVARQLVEDGIVGNEYLLARILVRAFLVDIGEDYIPSARLSDQLRRMRALPDREAVIRYHGEVSAETKEVKRFSPESIVQIREQFLKEHPQSSFVDGSIFTSPPPDWLKPQGDQENFHPGRAR